MTTNETEPGITDQRAASRGRLALSKNAQMWFFIGVAALILCVTFFGNSTPKAKPGSATPTPTPGGPKSDELAGRLATQQAEERRLQGVIANQAQATPEATPIPLSPQDRAILSGALHNNAANSGPFGSGGEVDQLAEARRTQAYKSLFSSNVALSYRPRPTVQAAGPGGPMAAVQPASETPTASDAEIAQLAALLQGGGIGQPARPVAPSASGAQAKPPALNVHNRVTDGSRGHTVFEGTILEAVLLTRINADFAGPILCHVSTPLLSRSRQHVLIPAGTRVLGQVQKIATFGQERVAVAFHRLIMPDGYAINLDQFTGLSVQGETALKDQVNHHYTRMFGSSIALGAVSGLAALGTNYGIDNVSMTDRLRQGTAGGIGQSAQSMLQPFLNTPPTLTIREGHRVRIYFTQDLEIPPYAQHQMDADL